MNSAPMHGNASGATAAACEVCGSQFDRRKRWQRFCGEPCRNAYHRDKRTSRGALTARIEQLEQRVAALEALSAR